MFLFRPSNRLPDGETFCERQTITTPSYLFVRRTGTDGGVSEYLVGNIDLESYSPHVGMGLPIRAAQIHPGEKTEAKALPILCMDDWEKRVIEPLSVYEKRFQKIQDIQKDVVHTEVFLLPEEANETIADAIAVLSDVERFKSTYRTDSDAPLVFAVAKGNSLLVTAKRRWEEEKKNLSPKTWENHPHRFFAVRLYNLHSNGISFYPIHRICQNVDSETLTEFILANLPTVWCGDGQAMTIRSKNRSHTVFLSGEAPMVSILSGILQRYLASHGECSIQTGEDDTLSRLSGEERTVAIRLSPIKKEQLFPGIITGGILPEGAFRLETE